MNYRPTPETDAARRGMQHIYDCGRLHQGVENLLNKIESLERQRDTLLESLVKIEQCDGVYTDAWMRDTARAAIAAVKGEKQ